MSRQEVAAGKQVAAEKQVVCPDPVNLQESDRFLFDFGKVMKIPPLVLETHQDVDAYGRGPLSCQGESLREWFIMPDVQVAEYRSQRKHWRDNLERLFQPAKTLDRPALWITDNWSCGGYFHWTCDALPRLESALEDGAAEPGEMDEFTLLLPSKAKRSRFIRDTLSAYGLKNVRVLGRFEHLRCPELLVPRHIAPTGSYRPEIMQRMRDRFVRHTAEIVPEASLRRDDRIYISRQLAGRRRIANESDLLPILEEFDFRIVLAEKESWARQIQMAAGARIVASNHGAGLTNMIAMKPGSRVFEICDHLNTLQYCYYTLAAAMDLQYYYMLAERQHQPLRRDRAHMLVDPAAFRATIQRIVEDDEADRSHSSSRSCSAP